MTYDTTTIDGLATMFYTRAAEQGRTAPAPAVFGPGSVKFHLTKAQFQWLRDVARRRGGIVFSGGRRGRDIVQGDIIGLGSFVAEEWRYGSAMVTVMAYAQHPPR